MGKNNVKFEYEYVKNYFESRNCILLSKIYINCGSPLEYICHCGKKNTLSFTKFKQQKNGCKYCTKIAGYTHNEVAEYFLQYGCELLEQYKGVKENHSYRCSCGNISTITFDNFKNGERCKDCGLKKLAEYFKHSLKYVQQYFYDNGCVPLFDEYNNSKTPLKYQCSCGNISKISFSDFQVGKRCVKCGIKKARKTMYENGTQMCSIQQKYIHSLVGGELNYPVNSSSLDIAFPDKMIYIEYDGSGHDLSVKLKTISQSGFNEKEKRRRYALYNRGWKEIKIISKNDKLPILENIIKEMIKYGKTILESHSWIVFDIDNLEVRYRNYIGEYDFGELKRFRRDYVS